MCWGGILQPSVLGRGGLADEILDDSYVARPVALPNGTVVTEVAVTESSACAIDSNGGLWCWGYGAYGQLATGAHISPVLVTLAVP
jgi:alpha-tubulin suppressor-like RCC1 family protein